MPNAKNNFIKIGSRYIGADFRPFVIAEIGINHEGNFNKAKKLIDSAKQAGVECVKFQSHIVEDEMTPIAKKVIPSHTKDSIWDIMVRCSFSEDQELALKKYTESLGLIYLSTPFSRAAANRLEKMGVLAYKIGSGECNNYPLVEHIASFGKPIILSTGMNNLDSIGRSVEILRKRRIPFALLHCTSMYPAPYEKMRLGAMSELRSVFPDAVIGLSDHTVGNYIALGAVALGASIIEEHFTASKKWPGPDIALSADPKELKELILGADAIYQAGGGGIKILKEEKPVIDFAYACVVAIKDIKKGEKFSKKNIWVKRPGTGQIKAKEYRNVLGRLARKDIKKDSQLKFSEIR